VTGKCSQKSINLDHSLVLKPFVSISCTQSRFKTHRPQCARRGFVQTAVSKARRWDPRPDRRFFQRRASDTALAFRDNDPPRGPRKAFFPSAQQFTSWVTSFCATAHSRSIPESAIQSQTSSDGTSGNSGGCTSTSGAFLRRNLAERTRSSVITCDNARPICPIRGQSCKSQRFALAATLDDLMGDFSDGLSFPGRCNASLRSSVETLNRKNSTPVSVPLYILIFVSVAIDGVYRRNGTGTTRASSGMWPFRS
jgi:hypothetical protein